MRIQSILDEMVIDSLKNVWNTWNGSRTSYGKLKTQMFRVLVCEKHRIKNNFSILKTGPRMDQGQFTFLIPKKSFTCCTRAVLNLDLNSWTLYSLPSIGPSSLFFVCIFLVFTWQFPCTPVDNETLLQVSRDHMLLLNYYRYWFFKLCLTIHHIQFFKKLIIYFNIICFINKKISNTTYNCTHLNKMNYQI
jgi:hypothetical protein